MKAAAAPRLVLTLNGLAVSSTAATLAELLIEQGYTGAKVATAVNGAFVSERERAVTRLADGDAIEVVSARQGG